MTMNSTVEIGLRRLPAKPRIAFERLSQWIHHSADWLIKVASVLTLIGIWYVAAFFLPPSVMPAPHVVARVLITEVIAGPIWIDVGITLARICIAFTLAMSIALIVGFTMGIFRLAEKFFDIWLVCGITMPSLVTIITIYMIVGLNDRAAVLAASLPVVAILTINIWEGVKTIDQKLIGMSKAYHASQFRIIKSVIAPQMMPVILASARFGLGLIWKMTLFVELIGRSNGIGYRIEYWYQLFNMSEVLAHALLFLFIMLFIEIVLLGKLEKYLFRWRPIQLRI